MRPLAHKEKVMTKKILIAGFACWSVFAVAQATGTKDQTASAEKDQHPKDVASGQASGKAVAPMKMTSAQPAITDNKKTSQPAGSQAVLNSDSAASEQVKAPRDLATGQASGKRQYAPVTIRKVSDDESMAAREQQSPKATGKSAQDDWQTPAAKTAAPANSNGQTRVATGDVNGDGKADAAINNSHSNIKNSKDAATGQTTAKRQHSDITITKHSDEAPQQ
jgi:FG-GAP repeat protein